MLYLLNQIFLKAAFSLQFLHFYLNDFLFPIACIPLFLQLKNYLGLRQKRELEFAEIIRYCALFFIFFEIFLPLIRNGATSDFFDGLAYFLGGFTLFTLRRFA
jgi:hypothetical protein